MTLEGEKKNYKVKIGKHYLQGLNICLNLKGLFTLQLHFNLFSSFTLYVVD